MNKKPKLLWVGDAVAVTGFARVTHNLLGYLGRDFEIVVLASNFHGDPHGLPYKIYPATNRFASALFGEQRIRDIVLKENPDIVFCINDSWIINDLYTQIADLHDQGKFKFVGYYPVDGIDWFNVLSVTANNWDQVLVYTKFGCEEARKAGLKQKPVYFPHGIDPDVFYPTDKIQARKDLKLPLDKFIVFNGNRNQPRKRIDLTIKAFAKMAQNAPDAVLYLHMGNKDMGWNIQQLFAKEMIRYDLDPARRLILSGTKVQGNQQVSIDMLNQIYNAADVGVNTCEGEGWGLVNFEHAACRVAQIVPNHTACKEIFEGAGDLIDIEHAIADKDFGRDMFAVSVDHLASLLEHHYNDPHYSKERAETCYQRVTDPQFHWETLGPRLSSLLQKVLHEEHAPVGFQDATTISVTKKNKKKTNKTTSNTKELVTS